MAVVVQVTLWPATPLKYHSEEVAWIWPTGKLKQACYRKLKTFLVLAGRMTVQKNRIAAAASMNITHFV